MFCQKSLTENCRLGRCIVVMKLIFSLCNFECEGHTVHKLSQWLLTSDLLAPRESDYSWIRNKVSSDWLPSYIKQRDRFSRRSQQQQATNINVIAAVTTTVTSSSNSAAPTTISSSSQWKLFQIVAVTRHCKLWFGYQRYNPKFSPCTSWRYGEILTPALGEGECLASNSVSCTPRKDCLYHLRASEAVWTFGEEKNPVLMQHSHSA
jgi:hypothetical protein